MNACKVANKKIEDITLVINGAGAAGCAIGKLLLSLGIGNLIMVDREGIICEGDNYLNEAHAEMAKVTNKNKSPRLSCRRTQGCRRFRRCFQAKACDR